MKASVDFLVGKLPVTFQAANSTINLRIARRGLIEIVNHERPSQNPNSIKTKFDLGCPPRCPLCASYQPASLAMFIPVLDLNTLEAYYYHVSTICNKDILKTSKPFEHGRLLILRKYNHQRMAIAFIKRLFKRHVSCVDIAIDCLDRDNERMSDHPKRFFRHVPNDKLDALIKKHDWIRKEIEFENQREN